MKLTREMVLKEQVEELEKLLALKNARIAELEFQLNFSSLQSKLITVPCDHDFPAIWFGTVAPPCRKCGVSSVSTVITSQV